MAQVNHDSYTLIEEEYVVWDHIYRIWLVLSSLKVIFLSAQLANDTVLFL